MLDWRQNYPNWAAMAVELCTPKSRWMSWNNGTRIRIVGSYLYREYILFAISRKWQKYVELTPSNCIEVTIHIFFECNLTPVPKENEKQVSVPKTHYIPGEVIWYYNFVHIIYIFILFYVVIPHRKMRGALVILSGRTVSLLCKEFVT